MDEKRPSGIRAAREIPREPLKKRLTMWCMGWVEVVFAVVVILFGLYGWYQVKHAPGRDWWDGGGP